jgi:hypothetical protein
MIERKSACIMHMQTRIASRVPGVLFLRCCRSVGTESIVWIFLYRRYSRYAGICFYTFHLRFCWDMRTG